MKKPTVIAGLVVFAGLLAFCFFLASSLSPLQGKLLARTVFGNRLEYSGVFLPEERALMAKAADPLFQ